MWWIFLQGNLCGVTLMEVGGRSQSFARLCVTGINNDIRVFLSIYSIHDFQCQSNCQNDHQAYHCEHLHLPLFACELYHITLIDGFYRSQGLKNE